MTDLLNPDHHANLIRNIELISKQTNVPINVIKTASAKDYCSTAEMTWLRAIKTHLRDGQGGMLFTKYPANSSSIQKSLAIAATLIRNSIDARVYPVNTLLAFLEKGNDVPVSTVIIIPNLCNSDMPIANWQSQKLYNFLIERYASNRMIIGYVESMDKVATLHSRTFAEHLNSHYDLFDSDFVVA
jgi:hypothetical protein